MTQAPKHKIRWLTADAIPAPLTTDRFVTEPLNEQHAELDFAAIMLCRGRLREELQWGNWPPDDFTVELNRADLRGHYEEFNRGEAFAYTVLSPDRAKCLGCLYLERCPEIEGAQLAFWVIDDAIAMEGHLVSSAIAWVHRDWHLPQLLIPLRETNPRGITLAHKCGLKLQDSSPDSPLSDHHWFVSDSADHSRSGSTALQADRSSP